MRPILLLAVSALLIPVALQAGISESPDPIVVDVAAATTEGNTVTTPVTNTGGDPVKVTLTVPEGWHVKPFATGDGASTEATVLTVEYAKGLHAGEPRLAAESMDPAAPVLTGTVELLVPFRAEKGLVLESNRREDLCSISTAIAPCGGGNRPRPARGASVTFRS